MRVERTQTPIPSLYFFCLMILLHPLWSFFADVCVCLLTIGDPDHRTRWRKKGEEKTPSATVTYRVKSSHGPTSVGGVIKEWII